MKNWVYKRTPEIPEGLVEELGVSKTILKILLNRGLRSPKEMEDYLEASMDSVSDGSELTDMEKGVNIIWQAVRDGKKIRVMGDYDVDGVTATYILTQCLSMLGADCDHFIPHRVEDGYGLHVKAVQDAYDAGVQVLLTCDNGIAATDAIQYAKRLGMTTVVTDHHEIPCEDTESGREFILPPADAVIDPKRDDNVFQEVCGAVVAWKFAGLLMRTAGKEDLFNTSDFVEFAALGTVCDVMPLLYENRSIVKEGLLRCARTNNVGLHALLETLELEGKRLTSFDFGFVIGPCINAEGRLGTAEDAYRLFCEKDHDKALEMASKMKEMNSERQDLTRKGTEEAFAIVDKELADDRVLVVYLPDCHESIAGIIAGRVREKYYRPTIILTDGKALLKGSGRSVAKYSMYEELSRCGDLLAGFGGHPMAAGLSLKKENLEPLRKRLNENCSLTEKDLSEKRLIDAVLPVDYLSESFVRSLAVLEPFGKGNEKPVFAQKHVKAYSAEIIGRNRNVLRVRLASSGCKKAIGFRDVEENMALLETKSDDFDMLYYPTINVWKGVSSVQAEIIDIR